MGAVAAFVWIVAGVVVCVGVFFVGFISGGAWYRAQTLADLTRVRASVAAEERAKVWHGRN
jgi:hypothetical protein